MPFADFAAAQRYYAIHPDAQPIIDPDQDGYACEVWFGVDTTAIPPPGAPAGTGTGLAPTRTPVWVPPTEAPYVPPAGPVRTGYGGLDGVDYDCWDFATQGQAQAYFEADGGSSANNVDALDRNNNGLACEPGEFD